MLDTNLLGIREPSTRLAFLVCSPRLLEARCRSIEEMELVNALCRLAEYAEASPA